MSGANYKLVTPGNRRRLISAWRVVEFKIESLELKFRSFKIPSERGVWQIERSSGCLIEWLLLSEPVGCYQDQIRF